MWMLLQGMVFSPIPFQPDDLLTKHEAPDPDDAEVAVAEGVPRASLLSTIAESFKQMLFPSYDVSHLNFAHFHCLVLTDRVVRDLILDSR
jgi:hypothetical protein